MRCLTRLRLVALAAQRFIASVLDEAINIHKRRRLAPAAQLRADGHDPRDKRVVLSTEELTEALKEVRSVMWRVRHAPIHTEFDQREGTHKQDTKRQTAFAFIAVRCQCQVGGVLC